MPLPAKQRELRRQQIVELAAQGKTQTEIARTVGIDQSTVGDYLAKPKSVEELEHIRMRVRTLVMEQAGDGLVEGTLGVVRKAIADGDAKSLELATRASLNLEKLTASASGEARKVEVQGMPPAVDVRALLIKYANAEA